MTLPSGKTATLRQTDGYKTTIVSPESSPPGSVVRAKVEGIFAEFQLKVRACQKEGDVFVIEGRTQNATRELKAWLLEAD
jgi:hypothetical protein